jgi:hypothetical protein
MLVHVGGPARYTGENSSTYGAAAAAAATCAAVFTPAAARRPPPRVGGRVGVAAAAPGPGVAPSDDASATYAARSAYTRVGQGLSGRSDCTANTHPSAHTQSRPSTSNCNTQRVSAHTGRKQCDTVYTLPRQSTPRAPGRPPPHAPLRRDRRHFQRLAAQNRKNSKACLIDENGTRDL